MIAPCFHLYGRVCRLQAVGDENRVDIEFMKHLLRESKFGLSRGGVLDPHQKPFVAHCSLKVIEQWLHRVLDIVERAGGLR